MGYLSYRFPTFKGDLADVRWNQLVTLQNDLLARRVRFLINKGAWHEFVVQEITFVGEATGFVATGDNGASATFKEGAEIFVQRL